MQSITYIINTLIRALKERDLISTKDIEDNFYSVRDLYENRVVLFKTICHTYPKLSWKTKMHNDGTMFNDSFLAGITTPKGDATYHIKMEHFDEFQIKEIGKGPIYDGYKANDVLTRINSLPLLKSNYIETDKYRILIEEPTKPLSEEELKKQKLTKLINQLLAYLKELDIIKTVDVTDGNHKLKELYKQKRELFKFICHNYPDLAWKSLLEDNNTFIAGLNTPLGPACYILNKEHFEEFNVNQLRECSVSKEEASQDFVKKMSSLKIRQMI